MSRMCVYVCVCVCDYAKASFSLKVWFFSDLLVQLEGGHQVHAHKFVLLARSDEWASSDLAHVTELDMSGKLIGFYLSTDTVEPLINDHLCLKTTSCDTLFFLCPCPWREAPVERPRMSVWSYRAVIWSTLLSPLLFFCHVTLSVSSGFFLFCFACWPILLTLFFQKILQCFSFRGRLFCMAPV